MAITIENNGASIKITDGTQVRNITKTQVVEVSVIKTNIIRINIGQGALHNVFINFLNVTIPTAANAELLRDLITAMLTSDPVLAVGSATEAKQIEEIINLNAINATIVSLQSIVNILDNKIFYEPIRVDDSNPMYNGFASPASAENVAVWAIQRIETINGVNVYTWADGNKNFDNIWEARESLNYS